MKYRTGFLVFLLALTLISYGCGSGGGDASTQYGGDTVTEDTVIEDVGSNTARVSLTLDFPDDAEVATALLSVSTTHILVNVKQWLTDDLNKLSVINTDKTLVIVSGGTTVTLDLLPTWTRICASQWKGDPNDTVTSTLLETTCTFGELVGGDNPISLTMIRGTWTLSAPFDDVQAVALTRTATQDNISGVDVFDGIPEAMSFQSIPTQAYNNWGSVYGTMFQQFGSYQTLPNAYGYYQNSFSSTDPNLPLLFFGSGEDVLTSVGPPATYETVGFAIGGFPNATTIDPLTGMRRLNDTRKMISFTPYQSVYPVPGESCVYEGYDYYYCYSPVLLTLDTSVHVDDIVGTDVTAVVFDDCQLTITGGNVIDACAFSEIDIVETAWPLTGEPPISYTYKITSTATTQGASICYSDGDSAGKDSLGNTICTSYEYSWTTVGVCNDPGMTGGEWPGGHVCEQPLESVCTYQGGAYNAGTTPTCTIGTTDYSAADTCSSFSSETTYYNSFFDVCWNYNYYWVSANNCWNGGTFNTATNRCEATLEKACLGYVPEPGETYDAATETCTYTSSDSNAGYFDVLNFTPVTLTGVGSLPSSVGFGP